MTQTALACAGAAIIILGTAAVMFAPELYFQAEPHLAAVVAETPGN